MKLTVLLALSLVLSPALSAHNPGYADLVEKVHSAVVSIKVVQEARTSVHGSAFDFFNRDPRRRENTESGGTGFVISSDGYIVTNRHVVGDADKIEVEIDGNPHEARLLGIDHSLDVAVLKIDAKGLSYLSFGDSDKMRIGDAILALGYPLGLGFTVTTGIISGKGRDFPFGNIDVGSYFQSDADITFGNSGGPLINPDGEVIAINTLIVERGETFGFSIPSNQIKTSVEHIRKFGKVKRGALGVSVGELTDDAKEYYGVDDGIVVTTLTPGMPAQKAGIKVDDIILEIDGVKMSTTAKMISTISAKMPEDKITLTLLSQGKQKTKTVALGDRAVFFEEDGASARVEAPRKSEKSDLGFSMLPLDSRIRRDLNLDRDIPGVIVDRVEEESEIRKKGMRPGTIITHVNGEEVRSPADVHSQIDKIAKGKLIAFRVRLLDRAQGRLTQPQQLFLRKR